MVDAAGTLSGGEGGRITKSSKSQVDKEPILFDCGNYLRLAMEIDLALYLSVTLIYSPGTPPA
ncbi:MAG: hypothetical protein ACXW52_22300 [Candidatus Binatia bacterium]